MDELEDACDSGYRVIGILARAEGSVPPSSRILQYQAWGEVCTPILVNDRAARGILFEEFP